MAQPVTSLTRRPVFICEGQKTSPSGATDESLGNGTKEDTIVPSVVDGSIPPNKSDLTKFGVYKNKGTDGHDYLYLYWERTNTLGSANMDFEFNQSQTPSANGETPIRTAGDILITFDFASGGNKVELGLLRWVKSGANSQCEANGATTAQGCWGNRVDLDAAANADGAVSADQKFGEAAIDLTDTVFSGNSCAFLGSAYLKSRSSDSFTAALKDFVPPAPVNISNSGKIIIDKVTVPDPDPSDTEFPMTLTGGPASQNLSQSFSLTNDDPVHDSGAILPSGSTPYVAAETTPLPPGWQLDSATCVDTVGANSTPAAIDLSAGETVTCTFTNSKLETNISTEQSFIPKDKATITGSPSNGFNGTVDFRLFSGSNCGNNTDALFEDLSNQLSNASSGVDVTTDNDGTADAGTKNGYTITGTGGTFSWKVNYTPAQGENHPAAEYCHEDSTVTIDNDDTQ